VFRLRALASARPVVVVLVAVAIGAAGCKVDLTTATSDHHGGKAHAGKAHSPKGHAKKKHHAKSHPGKGQAGGKGTGATGTAATGSVYAEPGAGFSPVYRLINGAKHSIDLTMFELEDTTAEHDLGAAAKRGVNVRVILDEREKSTNTDAASYLTSHGAKVVWSSTMYQYTHQKTLVTDQDKAMVMSANLTSKYYPTTRDFLVQDNQKADITAIVTVFDADFAHKSVTPSDGHDLVWSPTDATDRLLALINSAKKNLRVYFEELSSSRIVTALDNAAKRGVSLQLVGEDEDHSYDKEFTELANDGAKISYFHSSTGYYIHAKMVEADYGTKKAAMFIGSENMTTSSLTRNRELGLIISNHAPLAAMIKTFAGDYSKGTHWPDGK
jgi:cardiolipin synthase A/B